MFLAKWFGAAALVLLVTPAIAQTPGQFSDGQPLCANVPNPKCPGQTLGLNSALALKSDFPFLPSAVTGVGGVTFSGVPSAGNVPIASGPLAAVWQSFSLGLDTNFGSTRGSILERGVAGWQIITPGTSGLPWISNGTGADPAYQAPTTANLVTWLEAANNNAPTFAWYNSNDVSTSGLFGTPLFQVIAGGLQNTIIGQAIQNQASASFPTGITGYGKLLGAGAGNQVFGVYGRADCLVAGSCNNELDVNNTSANDAPTTTPINNIFGTTSTWPVDLFIAAGGTKKSYAGIYFVGVPGSANQFQYGIYQDKAVINTAGIFLDADATHSPTNSLIVKNTGLGSNIPVIVQTLGTYTKTNPVFEILDLGGNLVSRITQDGSLAIVSSPAAASSDILSVSITNNNTGSISSSFQAITNAGTMRMEADSTAGGSNGVLRWTGSGTLFFDMLNATGNLSIRTGATPTAALNISASQVISVPAITTGTPTASLCIDASNNIIKKTTAGSCI